jgi:homoserine kinase
MEEYDGCRILSLDQDIPQGPDNLVFASAKYIYELCGRPFPGLYIEQENNIPQARGLGSSSACIIGGIVGANAMLGNPFSQDEVINIAAVMEGHPDNSTPALIGGLVTAVIEGEKVYYVKQEIGESLRFAVMVPDFELKTSVARGCLPESVPHMDARYNLGRAALMAVSLYSGKYENLKVAAGDRLHQPFRLKYIPNAEKVMDLCYSSGAYSAYISGAGPAIMAIFNDNMLDFPRKMRDGLCGLGLEHWELLILCADNKGVIVSE